MELRINNSPPPMKYLIRIFMLGMWLSGALSAQDMIITSYDDTIACKITKMGRDFVSFNYVHRGKVRKTILRRDQVRFYRNNYYVTPVGPARSVILPDLNPHWRLAVKAGISYDPTKPPGSLQHVLYVHDEKLTLGQHVETDLSWFWSEYFGVGIVFNRFWTRNSMDNVHVRWPNGSVQTGTVSDDITTDYAGLGLSIRTLDLKRSSSSYYQFGFGQFRYRDDAILINPFTVTGITSGFHLITGYDFAMSSDYAIEVQFSEVFGTLKEVKIAADLSSQTVILSKSEYHYLTRFDFSLGIRFLK